MKDGEVIKFDCKALLSLAMSTSARTRESRKQRIAAYGVFGASSIAARDSRVRVLHRLATEWQRA
jgi:hypothetical protein